MKRSCAFFIWQNTHNHNETSNFACGKFQYIIKIKEIEENIGHYFVVTSPNVQGMIVEGDTLEDAIEEASFDIADWLEVKGKIEKVADPSKWHLEKDEKLVYVLVNLIRK